METWLQSRSLRTECVLQITMLNLLLGDVRSNDYHCIYCFSSAYLSEHFKIENRPVVDLVDC